MFLRNNILVGAALAALTCATASQTAAPTPTAQHVSSVTSEQAAAPRAPAVHPVGIARASQIIGRKVVDGTDRSVGEIKDLIACSNGDLIALIARGSDELLVAAPLGTLSPRLTAGSEVVAAMTAEVDRFVLMTGGRLAGAPVVTDRSRIDEAWCKAYCEYYGLAPMVQLGQDGDAPKAGMPMQGRGMECLAALLGHDLKSARGEPIGKVKDVAVDLEDSRIAYVVVSTGGTLGFGTSLHAVPLASLTSNAEGRFCTLQADQAELERTVSFEMAELPAREHLEAGALGPAASDRGAKPISKPR